MSREFYLRYPRRRRSTAFREEFTGRERRGRAHGKQAGNRRARRKTRKQRFRL